jgi:hypothetical protein
MEIGVRTVVADEFIMRAGFNDATLVQECNLFGMADG